MGRLGKKIKKQQAINSANQTASEKEAQFNEDGTVNTSLYFHPEWELTVAEKYIYQFRHQKLPALLPDQLSIAGINLIEDEDDIIVETFLRNTLSKSVRFEEVDLLLLDAEGQVLAKKRFELDEVSEIPGLSCMPWRFLFGKEDRVAGDIPAEGWKIAFELKNKTEEQEHLLDLDETWEKELSSLQKENLQNLITTLPKLSPGEINLMGIEAKFNEDGALAVVILVRNGNEKNIKLETIPLVVEDAQGDVVCEGGFNLSNFEVKANTSKPWTFIFPSSLIQKQEPDLSRWKAYAPAASLPQT